MSESTTMTVDEDTDYGGSGFNYRRFYDQFSFNQISRKEETLTVLKKIFPWATFVAIVVLLGMGVLLFFSLKPQPANPTLWGIRILYCI